MDGEKEVKLTPYELEKARTAITSILNLSAIIKTPGVASADGIVGVTDELKASKPVPAIMTQEQADVLTAAVKKAAIEGRHNILAGILSGVRDVVAKVTGLGDLFS